MFMCLEGEIAVGFSPRITISYLNHFNEKGKIAYLTGPAQESHTKKEIFRIKDQPNAMKRNHS